MLRNIVWIMGSSTMCMVLWKCCHHKNWKPPFRWLVTYKYSFKVLTSTKGCWQTMITKNKIINTKNKCIFYKLFL